MLAILPLCALLVGAMPTMTVLPDLSTPIAVVSLSIPAGLNRQANNDNGLAAFTAYSILETEVGEDSLVDAVRYEGGAIAVDVGSSQTIFTVRALPDRLNAILALLAAALAHPQFSAVSMQRTRMALQQQFERTQSNGVLLAQQMINGVESSANESAATPLGLPATIISMSSDRVRQFYREYYHRAGARVVAITPLADENFSILSQALVPGRATPIIPSSKPLAASSRELQASRANATQAYVLSFRAPAPNDPAAPAAFVFAEMLRASIVQMSELPEIPSRSLSDSAIDVTYDIFHQPARYLVKIDGTMGNAPSVVRVTMSLAQALSVGDFHGSYGHFIALAKGRLALRLRTPTRRVRAMARALNAGFPADEYTRLDTAISRVDAMALNRAARGLRFAPTVAIINAVEGN